MLDRSHLEIIRAVNRTGSLTRAAHELHLTQPALSHSIKKLEQRLETAIWTKEGRHLRLTPAGEYVLRLAERLLPQFEHAEELLADIAAGQRGILRIGMECHPCYQWLLKVVSPYLDRWPKVDVDVKRAFQFGGIGALFTHEIDLLVTPDPLYKSDLVFEAVFAYEQVLVVGKRHRLASVEHVLPEDLSEETLITYPVETERLDIFNQFLTPASCSPKRHKIIEATDIMLQMVAAGRGVAALPRWLVDEYAQMMPIAAVRLGEAGIAKQIFLGMRKADTATDYLASFVQIARETTA